LKTFPYSLLQDQPSSSINSATLLNFCCRHMLLKDDLFLGWRWGWGGPHAFAGHETASVTTLLNLRAQPS